MAPPPLVTPSPRRFLTANKQSDLRKPASSLRAHVIEIDGASEQSTSNRAKPGSSQFAGTPRFSFQQEDRRNATSFRTTAPGDPFGRLKHLRTETSEDSIEEPLSIDDEKTTVQQDESDEDMLFKEADSDLESAVASDIPELALRSPKRARIESKSNSPDATAGTVSTSPHASSKTPHRFLPRAALFNNSTVPAANSPMPPRPQFLEPDALPEDTTDPLPHIFSPHRKTQKFLLSGLAATMRTHIVEATTSRSNPTRSSGGWQVRVRTVSGSLSDGMIMVNGVADDETEEKLLLVSRKDAPQPGQYIIVKGVNWSINLQGERWAIALDWSIED